MNAILWIFIAISFGVMLFVSIQKDIPDEFGFLKADPATSAVKSYESGRYVLNSVVIVTISKEDDMVELKLPVKDKYIESVSFLCNAGKIDSKVDTLVPTTGSSSTNVRINNVIEKWRKGASNSIFPNNPSRLRDFIVKNKSMTIAISSISDGIVISDIDSSELATAFSQLPSKCW